MIYKMALILAVLFSLPIHGAEYKKSINDHFYIRTISEAETNAAVVASVSENCRDHIKQIICILPPPQSDKNGPLPRICEPGGEAYASYFESIYDAYPEVLQKMFCSLRVINIEKQFFGTAYAGLVKDSTGKTIGAEMGIRKSVLDENLDLRTWSTWKEQLSFGGLADRYEPTEGLPSIVTETHPGKVSDFLYFVIAHEFGHMLDFANEINKTTSCTPGTDGQDADCLMTPESWGAISWTSEHKPKLDNDFNHRKDLCFYWCENKFIQAADIPKLYTDLYESEFISIYATTQPWDDFADSLAYFIMNDQLHTQYSIRAAKGFEFDIMAKLKSPRWAKKYRYIESLINNKNLIYP